MDNRKNFVHFAQIFEIDYERNLPCLFIWMKIFTSFQFYKLYVTFLALLDSFVDKTIGKSSLNKEFLSRTDFMWNVLMDIISFYYIMLLHSRK